MLFAMGAVMFDLEVSASHFVSLEEQVSGWFLLVRQLVAFDNGGNGLVVAHWPAISLPTLQPPTVDLVLL